MTQVSVPKIYNFDAKKSQAGKNLHETKDYEENPHKAIIDYCSAFIDGIRLAPSKILVATYRRPARTSGGIIMAGSHLDEDKWQGVAALVLKLGSSAFIDDATTTFGGFSAKQFEWVTFRPSLGVAREFNGLHCRIIQDSNIDAVIEDPTLVW